MTYAHAVLAKFGQIKGGRFRNKLFVNSVPCAYCRGSGVDPAYGNTSHCPICGASGKIAVTSPVMSRLKCGGTGRERGKLSCLTCKGIGVASVSKDATTYTTCLGTGKDGVFHCTLCKGQGIV